MYPWDTDKITADLLALDCIEKVYNDGPGGDVDTDNLRAKVRDVSNEYIYVCGFHTDDYIENPSNTIVEMVEITDQGGYGLKSSDYAVAQAYIVVRQYFVDCGADVVDHLKDYF